MRAPVFSVGDFASAILRLLPSGPIWPRSLDSMVATITLVWSPTFQRNGQRAENLLADAFPGTAVELLGEWESTLGLPDPCAGPNPILSQRQAQVVARLTDTGGSSAQYYINLAKQLGYDITIDRFTASRFGQAHFGDRYLDEAWSYVWQVNCESISIESATFGASQYGNAYRAWGGEVLVCEIISRAPGRTRVLFNFASGNPGNLDSFRLDIDTLS